MLGIGLAINKGGLPMGLPPDPLIVQTASGQYITTEEDENIVIEEAP